MNMRFVSGLIAGVLLVILFGGSKPAHTHYHANFALYVNGVQDTFDSFTFYEEVAGCSANGSNDPKHRAHLHDKNNHVIHVHDKGVTWGHFFANLGYGLTDKTIETDEGVFVDGSNGKRLSFILNGKLVENISNQLIKSEDVLLINYGSENSPDHLDRINEIPRDARQFNEKADPLSCSGR